MTFGFDFEYEEPDITDYFLMGAAGALLVTLFQFAASRLEGGPDL
uniref:Uncharacterized protein n=1 Tax=viral metagenome TaxID=1070528 RepID=A0A6C0M0P6_9ZZZZ